MSSNETTKENSSEQEGDREEEQVHQSRHSRPSQATPNYGSILSSQGTLSPQQGNQESIERTPQRLSALLPISTTPRADQIQSPSNPPMSPQVLCKTKKPPALRRASTKRQLPRPGQEFSVDDDPSELDASQESQAPQSTSFPQLRRQDTTIRRRTAALVTPLSRVDSEEEEQDLTVQRTPSREPTLEAEPGEITDDQDAQEINEEEDDGDVSDAESFTLRDRQLAINQTHPFGIRIWKPALYKKNRSVEKTAEEDIHSSPSASVKTWLWIFNVLWALLFGWWLAIACFLSAGICFLFAFERSALEYSRVFWDLARYLFYPFGQFVKLEVDENYAEEDEGEGRSISEYERWQTGDLEHGRLFFGPAQTTSSIIGRRRNSMESASETDSLLGRTGRQEHADTNGGRNNKRRIFGRGQWTLGRVVFYGLFYFFVAPLMLLASAACWMMVFWIPMARVSSILFSHLRRHPLALSFHPDASYARSSTAPSSILLCTYRAVGTKYWKYTVDGTNVFLINLLGIVVFVIVDWFILEQALGLKIWLTSPALLFSLALLSVVPLAYFIGQAVASISAQSSMGMGAAVNAFFSTIVEVYLYCVALNEGKGKLVEGSIIGSIFAGILFLPGLSMCFGAIKRKTQRFNVKSASATSTMLLFAVIAAFGPTLFYKIYGSHELVCYACSTIDGMGDEPDRDCRRCYFRQVPALNDSFFVDAVRPYCWFAAVMLFFSYIIGLLFTLRTHAAVIWTTDADEKKPVSIAINEVSPTDTRQQSMAGAHHLSAAPSPSYFPGNSIRDSALYKRILGQSLKQVEMYAQEGDATRNQTTSHKAPPSIQSPEAGQNRSDAAETPYLVPPKNKSGENGFVNIPGMPTLSEEENQHLATYVAEIAATAATVAARDATKGPRRASFQAQPSYLGSSKTSRPQSIRNVPTVEVHDAATARDAPAHSSGEGGGHDAPNWSKMKSSIVLCVATVAYALIAEVLVNTVDVVLQSVEIDEKFLGITLFALVPNTTEFLNAISFAMNGNIALSMEIGSAYALQVCLLQIPALVLFSAVHGRWVDPNDLIDHTFSLIFPQFDMVTVILCVFLLSYMYGEGKSNYFKGGILILTYLVVIMGFYYSGYTRFDAMGVDPTDTLAIISSPGMSSMMASQKRPAFHREL